MQTIDVIEFLSENYPKQALTETQIEFWLEALAEFEPDELRRAAVRLVKTSKWLPTLSEFIELARQESDERTNVESRRREYWAAMADFSRGDFSGKAWFGYERTRRPPVEAIGG